MDFIAEVVAIDGQVLKDMADGLDELGEQVRFLDCLKACGVDNWDGYEQAQEMYQEGE